MTDWTSFSSDDFFVPDFEVKVDGKTLLGETRNDLLNFKYQDDLDTLDSFEIEVNNWNEDKGRFKYSHTEDFAPGRTLELSLGYEGKIGLRRLILGEITGLEPVFSARAASRVTVSGLNVLHRLRDEQRSHVYEDLKDSEVAELIGRRLGLTLRTDSSAKAREEAIPYLIQDNRYDLVFLLERARRNGYDLVAEDDPKTVYFGPTEKVKGPRNILRYGQFALEVTARVSTAQQVGAVTVRSWSPHTKELFEHTARASGEFSKAFGRRKELVVAEPVHSAKEAATLAQATLHRIAKERITARGKSVGIPELRAGTLLEIRGLDERFSGEYFVTRSEHRFDAGGYTTRFECRREVAP